MILSPWEVIHFLLLVSAGHGHVNTRLAACTNLFHISIGDIKQRMGTFRV